jgi:hypothetical protein
LGKVLKKHFFMDSMNRKRPYRIINGLSNIHRHMALFKRFEVDRLMLKYDGAEEVTRTPDLLITNQLLYQLSYFGTKKAFLQKHKTGCCARPKAPNAPTLA